jgi:hypothetical protein
MDNTSLLFLAFKTPSWRCVLLHSLAWLWTIVVIGLGAKITAVSTASVPTDVPLGKVIYYSYPSFAGPFYAVSRRLYCSAIFFHACALRALLTFGTLDYRVSCSSTSNHDVAAKTSPNDGAWPVLFRCCTDLVVYRLQLHDFIVCSHIGVYSCSSPCSSTS